ncbi:transketolase [Chondromyces crocatus]|uniref:Transketolase n=1 Tax=Chondromyces crocatus TaxID=52 RepID=A0A0K1EJK1_CHOCO|nr:transketolase [Chondromyces crocatus]AKT40852.1 transketolase [Chondromyces crocatus]
MNKQANHSPELVEKAVHTIQMLAVDGVEKAKSGHPGTPMALAGIAFEIFTRHLRYDPLDPAWPDRDRFILSCGHASMLLYSMLHLAGYDLPMEQLKQFRQFGSRTPGHPESHLTPGVETTTGPLGQGIAAAVGIASSIRMLGARFNQVAPVSTARVFGIASDGDLMEGVSAEAASLAGHLKLDNLIFFYDDNKITIDGKTDLAFSEDVGRRYEAYGWHVQRIDGHNQEQIREALDEAVTLEGRPKLIIARTHIGIGSPNKQDTAKAHGEPLGEEEVKLTKQAIGWPLEPTFLVPDEVRAIFKQRAEQGKLAHDAWKKEVDKLQKAGGEKAALYERLMKRAVPENLLEELVKVAPAKDAATRAHSGVIEQRVAALVPSLVGGSADLNPSTKTYIEDSPAVVAGKFGGRNIHFGIREHAMGAFVNGVASSDGFIPFGSTFLIFSDYMRASIRIAALTHLQSLFVFTHDSIYLGEDGPTHQPVEQLWALRLIPNLDVVRPCDALECAGAWAHALGRKDGPTAFALTRQKVANIPREEGFDPKVMLRGAYTLADAKEPTLVIVATGSEVEVAVAAKKILDADGQRVRVVSALCWEQFRREDESYRDEVLPKGVQRVVLEVGVTYPWLAVVGEQGLVIGHDDFGSSAPDKVLQKEFGFTPEAVAERIRKHIAGERTAPVAKKKSESAAAKKSESAAPAAKKSEGASAAKKSEGAAPKKRKS